MPYKRQYFCICVRNSYVPPLRATFTLLWCAPCVPCSWLLGTLGTLSPRGMVGDPEGTSPGDGAPDGCSSQAGPDTSVKTLEEVHKLLPEDFHELKQMMVKPASPA